MSVLFYVLGAMLICASVLVGLVAPSDIQLTMAAVLFTGGVLAIGIGAVLWQAKANAKNIDLIKLYLAKKEAELRATKER